MELLRYSHKELQEDFQNELQEGMSRRTPRRMPGRIPRRCFRKIRSRSSCRNPKVNSWKILSWKLLTEQEILGDVSGKKIAKVIGGIHEQIQG